LGAYAAALPYYPLAKYAFYASQNYTLLMFNGTCVLKMNKNYIYDVTQCVSKYVVTDRFA